METTTPAGVCACHNRPQVDLLLRKSKVVREGERALSIRAQEDRGRAWAAENGYCVRKVWRENLSAWSDVQRPKYDAAMSAVLDGEVPCLWVYALDRFSRKGAEAVVPILGKARVIFDYERLDSSDERDRRWIIDRAENAREYSQRLSYNVRSTKGRQRTEGRWLSQAPWGLIADKTTRKLRPDTRPYMCVVATREEVSPWQVITRIFQEIANGTAGRALARKLNQEGLRTGLGAQWRVSQIQKIIKHPVFEGWLTVHVKRQGVNIAYLDDQGKRVRCAEPDAQMIPWQLAAKARRVLSGNQIMNSTPREGRAAHPLAGRMRCESCGYAMVADGLSYHCTSRTQGNICEAPASAYRPAIERYVVAEWAARLRHSDDEDPIMLAVAERWQALSKPEESEALAEARAELKAAQAALDKFHADDREGFYTGRSARYRIPHKNSAEKRLDAAEAQIAELAGDGSVDITFLTEGQAAEIWEGASPELRRDLLGLAVDMVTVRKATRNGRFVGDERVTIQWAEPEGAEIDADDFEEAA